MSNWESTFKNLWTEFIETSKGKKYVATKILALRPIVIGQCDKAGNIISHKAVMQWTEVAEFIEEPEDLVQGKDWDIVECKLLN